MEPIYRGKNLNLNYGRENSIMTTLSRHPFVYIGQKPKQKQKRKDFSKSSWGANAVGTCRLGASRVG